MYELKHCPFCGREAELIEHPTQYRQISTYSVECTLCGARTDCNYIQRIGAIGAWNRRTSEVKRGEWISVRERLPEEDGEYLAGRYGSDEVVLVRFTRDCFGMDFRLIDPEKEHRPAFYYEDDEWGTCEWEDVECWMPKPVPPKEAP